MPPMIVSGRPVNESWGNHSAPQRWQFTHQSPLGRRNLINANFSASPPCAGRGSRLPAWVVPPFRCEHPRCRAARRPSSSSNCRFLASYSRFFSSNFRFFEAIVSRRSCNSSFFNSTSSWVCWFKSSLLDLPSNSFAWPGLMPSSFKIESFCLFIAILTFVVFFWIYYEAGFSETGSLLQTNLSGESCRKTVHSLSKCGVQTFLRIFGRRHRVNVGQCHFNRRVIKPRHWGTNR